MVLRQEDEKIKRLYKYRPDNEHTLRLLECQELWFSFAKDFNDPFDCLFPDFEEVVEEDWMKLAESLSVSIEEKRKVLNYLKSINFDPTVIKEQYGKDNFKSLIVYCLSEIRDNILMWSHYANSHHGICIGFETLMQDNSLWIRHNDSDFNHHAGPYYHNFLPIYKVDYKDKYPPPYNFRQGKIDDLFAFFTTKATDWYYEKERRIVIPYGEYGEVKKNIIKFDKSALKEVIVGNKLNQAFIEKVFTIIQKDYIAKGHSVEVFESSLDEQQYKLNIRKIN